MSESIITINNLNKKFGDKYAVRDLSFEAYKGEIFAFLGSNGSGKTTTIRCLLDIYKPDSGELLIKGEKYTDSLNSILGYLPEERGLYTRAKVSELFIYFCNLRGIDTSKATQLMNEYLERVGLFEHKDKQISQLSSGMQQKVQIGLAIIHKPEILILDEPFKGLDPVNRQLFLDIFRDLKNSGTSILYSTHILDEAQVLADRLVIIKNGVRMAYGSVTDVRKEHGKDILHIEFDGEIKQNDKLFSSIITNRKAEITPNEGVDPAEILKYLVNSDLKINKYSLDYPSLNEIFIRITESK